MKLSVQNSVPVFGATLYTVLNVIVTWQQYIYLCTFLNRLLSLSVANCAGVGSVAR